MNGYKTLVQNIDTGRYEILVTFEEIKPGTVIEWGSNDGGRTAAKWVVRSSTRA